MALICTASDLTAEQQKTLVAVLEAMDFKPVVREGGVKLEYKGVFDHHALAAITAFEQFGGCRTILFGN